MCSFDAVASSATIVGSFTVQLSLDELKKLLSQNGYHRGVVNYNINDVLQKQQNRPLTPTITVSSQKENVLSFILFRATKQNRW